MNNKTNYRQLIALSVLGYVCFLMIRSASGILGSVTKIITRALNINSNVSELLDLIPYLIILAFWMFLIFRYLKGFTLSDIMVGEIPRKFGIRVGIITIALLLINNGGRYLEATMIAANISDYYPDSKILLIKTYSIFFLNFLQVMVIAYGFYKLFLVPENQNK